MTKFDPLVPAIVPPLPTKRVYENVEVLKQLTTSSRLMGELKGLANTLPNQMLLVNHLGIQEAKESSEIEQIVTTNDELFQNNTAKDMPQTPGAKEVYRYAAALHAGMAQLKQQPVISMTLIHRVHEALLGNNAGIRRVPGTVLRNGLGEVVYTPPQEYDELTTLLSNLLQYMNDEQMEDLDPLIKMAITHHQFESIHPFYDGNGRAGRILNVLYLVNQGLLNQPILYLSKYLLYTKNEYYKHLQLGRSTEDWTAYILYFLKGVETASRLSINLIMAINQAYDQVVELVKLAQPKLYSHELIQQLFMYPYSRIDLMMETMSVNRLTATKYLNALVTADVLYKKKVGRNSYYINHRLMRVLDNQAPTT